MEAESHHYVGGFPKITGVFNVYGKGVRGYVGKLEKKIGTTIQGFGVGGFRF